MRKILVGFDPKIYPEVTCFEELGKCHYVKYNGKQILNDFRDISGIITHTNTHVSREILERLSELEFIGTPSTGTNHIDVEYLRSFEIPLFSLNGSPALIEQITSTAEHTWLLVLSCMRRLIECHERVKLFQSWKNSDLRGHELLGKKIGLIGFGRLGKKVSEYAKVFGMDVVAYDPYISDVEFEKYQVERVGLETLFRTCDVISLHAKLNENNHNLVCASLLDLAKDGLILVNTARGELVNSLDLVNALKVGKVAAVGLDVLAGERDTVEQIPIDPLVNYAETHNQVIITPHVGGATLDAHTKVFKGLLEIIRTGLLY